MSNRPLNSDELGAKGESRFPELCLDARLKPAKPDRDRTGWDYVVTWPLAMEVILDRRPAPVVCHVQLKTVWVGSDAVTLNLGTLYNIVSDARPAFVVVLEVDDPSLAFVRMHIMHITGNFLAEILKRLRQAQVEGKAAEDVTFRASVARWGTQPEEVSGNAFRAFVEAAVAEGMSAYSDAKQALLQNVGYEKGRVRFRTVIEAPTHNDVVEGFLGLRPLRLKEAERFDDRFDMPVSLGLWDTTNASTELRPNRFDRGIVTIERTRDRRLLTFHGDIFTVPRDLVGPRRFVMEFRNSLIRVRVDMREKSGRTSSTINLATVSSLGDVLETAAVWRDFYTLMAWMASEPMSFELRTRRKRIDPLAGTAEPRPLPDKARRMERYARGAEIVDWAMVRAEAPGTKMTVEQIFEAADDLEVIKTIEQTPNEVTPIGFTTVRTENLPAPLEYDMLYVNSVEMGDFQIAYAARTRMKTQITGERMAWSSGPLQLAYVRKIKVGEKALEHFSEKARRVTGIVNWMKPTDAPPTFIDGDTGVGRTRRLRESAA